MEKKIVTALTIYFVLGLIFALGYAYFYHWTPLSVFSPPFYGVLLSWPFQLPGLIWDYQYYGLAGKVL